MIYLMNHTDFKQYLRHRRWKNTLRRERRSRTSSSP
jgi:hypothetical protein